MRLNSNAFLFLLEAEHVVSCFGFAFPTFVPQIHFAFVVHFLFFDLDVLTIFTFRFLLSQVLRSDTQLLKSKIFALLILVRVYPHLLEVSAIFVTHTLAVSVVQISLSDIELFVSFVLQILAASAAHLWSPVL